MKLKWIAILCIVAFLAVLSGCETVGQEHRGAAVGAGVGAATGAAAGGLLGRSTESAVIGGLAGAALGGVIGHYAYDQRRSREETAEVYGYRGDEGTVITLEDVGTRPNVVRPGEEVDLNMTYALLTPSADTDVSVVESREVRHQNQLIANPRAQVVRNGGTYSTTVPLRLSSNAPAGEYTVVYRVEAGGEQQERTQTFRVQ